MHKTVQITWLNGREFRRIRWHGPEVRTMNRAAVFVTFAVWEHKSPLVMTATLISRREV